MLPQRRKSAEEIAKLRESLGIPGVPSEEPESLLPPSFTPPPTAPAKVAPEPPAVVSKPESSEPASVALERAKPTPPSSPILEEPQLGESAEILSAASPKVVRSLRKSEQAPRESKSGSSDTAVPRANAEAIPQRRHSDRELMEMRRIQAAPPDRAISHIRHLAVPWPLVALGYLLPLLGALFAWLAHWTPSVPPMDFPAQWMADLSRQPWLGKAGFGLLGGLCSLGLIFAGSIAWKKPRSRHHAGFITIIAVLILAFGIIHHFAPTYGP